MTARERKKWEQRGEGGGWLSLLLFYSPWGKDMFRKLSFRWLNIQIAPLPMAPRSSPSSRLWLSMLGMRSCCTHPASGERPHSPLLNPDALSGRPAFDVLVIWRTQGYQLAVNSVTTLHRSQGQAAEPTEPAWPSSAQQLCRWWTWLIPRNAGLSSCSSVNDFIQRGEVTRGLVIKGLHFTVKTARLCAALQKNPFKKEEAKKGRKHPSVFGSRTTVLEQEASRTYFLSRLPSLLFPVSHCGRNNNWQANELLAHTVATARTMSLIGGGSLKCDFPLKEQRFTSVNGFLK